MDRPGDRRRVIFWARSRGHEIVTDLSQKVDVIVASEKADFSSRIFQESKTPIAFDLIDAYLCQTNQLEDFARGISKRLDKQIGSGLHSFTTYLKDFCKKSNVVICSSPEQEEIIREINKNTRVILDSHDEIPFRNVGTKLNLVNESVKSILWEGQSTTIPGLRFVSPALKIISQDNNLKVSFITDKNYYLVLGKYFRRRTFNLIQRHSNLNPDQIFINSWSPENLTNQAARSHLAIIPTDLSIPLIRLKPENRLLIMWRLGLPCLTSASPAYKRVANYVGVDSICETSIEWRLKMQQLLDDPELARIQAVKGQAYIRDHHTGPFLLKKWDEAIELAMSC